MRLYLALYHDIEMREDGYGNAELLETTRPVAICTTREEARQQIEDYHQHVVYAGERVTYPVLLWYRIWSKDRDIETSLHFTIIPIETDALIDLTQECPVCNGSGMQMMLSTCPRCQGRRKVFIDGWTE